MGQITINWLLDKTNIKLSKRLHTRRVQLKRALSNAGGPWLDEVDVNWFGLLSNYDDNVAGVEPS